MTRKNMSNFETIAKITEFGKQTVTLFPADSAAEEIIRALQSRVGELKEKAAARIAAKNTVQSSAESRKTAREKLRRSLTQANQIANSIHCGRVPKPVNGSDQALIDSGRGFIGDSKAVSPEFAKHGVDVTAAVEGLEVSIRDHNNAKAASAAATKAYDKAAEDAMALLPRFDALVQNYLKDNVEAVAAYAVARSSRRLKAHRTANKESGVEPAASSPAPVPIPAHIAASGV